LVLSLTRIIIHKPPIRYNSKNREIQYTAKEIGIYDMRKRQGIRNKENAQSRHVGKMLHIARDRGQIDSDVRDGRLRQIRANSHTDQRNIATATERGIEIEAQSKRQTEQRRARDRDIWR
jgi:hypothetical protein